MIKKSIDSLPLTQMELNILHANDIHTVRQLTRTKMSQLLWTKGLGRQRVKDIVVALEQYKLKLAYEKPFRKKSAQCFLD